MNDVGRNRIVIGAIAAVAIVAGGLLAGGLPKVTASSPAKQTSAIETAMEQGQVEQFQVRDYSEFATGADPDLPSSDWLGLVAGMTAKLALVIALIYLAVRALRHYVYRGGAVAPTKKPVSLLGSLSLSPNRTVYVLEVGRKVLVVGATQSQMSLLTEVTDPEAIDEMRVQPAQTGSADQFSSLLSAAARRFGTREITLSDAAKLDSLQLKIQEGRDFVQNKLLEVRESAARN